MDDLLPALSFTPAVGDLAFTPKQRSLLTLANELGRDEVRARAPRNGTERRASRSPTTTTCARPAC